MAEWNSTQNIHPCSPHFLSRFHSMLQIVSVVLLAALEIAVLKPSQTVVAVPLFLEILWVHYTFLQSLEWMTAKGHSYTLQKCLPNCLGQWIIPLSCFVQYILKTFSVKKSLYCFRSSVYFYQPAILLKVLQTIFWELQRQRTLHILHTALSRTDYLVQSLANS